MSPRTRRLGGLLALLAAVAGCGGGPVDCSPCSGATEVDLSGWWDGTGTPTGLRVCVDGRCGVQSLRPDQLSPTERRVGVVLATAGTTIRDLSIDVLVGDRSVGRAVGTDLALLPAPPPPSCNCVGGGVVALDPATRRLILRPS